MAERKESGMALWTIVELVESGAVSEDDGTSAWRSTDVAFGWFGARVVADVQADSYSFDARAKVKRDDFELPADLLERLAIRLYWLCSADMHAIGSDLGAANCNIEAVVREICYHAEAESILRKFRAGIAGAREAKRGTAQQNEGKLHVG
jgi:hypothetical protein